MKYAALIIGLIIAGCATTPKVCSHPYTDLALTAWTPALPERGSRSTVVVTIHSPWLFETRATLACTGRAPVVVALPPRSEADVRFAVERPRHPGASTFSCEVTP